MTENPRSFNTFYQNNKTALWLTLIGGLLATHITCRIGNNISYNRNYNDVPKGQTVGKFEHPNKPKGSNNQVRTFKKRYKTIVEFDTGYHPDNQIIFIDKYSNRKIRKIKFSDSKSDRSFKGAKQSRYKITRVIRKNNPKFDVLLKDYEVAMKKLDKIEEQKNYSREETAIDNFRKQFIAHDTTWMAHPENNNLRLGIDTSSIDAKIFVLQTNFKDDKGNQLYSSGAGTFFTDKNNDGVLDEVVCGKYGLTDKGIQITPEFILHREDIQFSTYEKEFNIIKEHQKQIAKDAINKDNQKIINHYSKMFTKR